MTDRPWMDALEQRLRAIAFGEAALRDRGTSKNYRSMIQDTLPALRRADTFAWSTDCFHAVQLAARTIPLDASYRPEDWPGEPQWHWFGWDADPRPMDNLEESVPDLRLCALLVCRSMVESRPGLSAWVFGRARGTEVSFPGTGWNWPLGQPLASMYMEEWANESPPLIRELIRFPIAAEAWLRQRIITVSSGPVERHRRKQLAREFALDTPVSDVKVIHLRRAEHEPHGSGGERQSVDWHCRWVVTGHWRHQACGTDHADRRLIYIWPYPKGPEDKPWRVPTATVHLVDR